MVIDIKFKLDLFMVSRFLFSDILVKLYWNHPRTSKENLTLIVWALTGSSLSLCVLPWIDINPMPTCSALLASSTVNLVSSKTRIFNSIQNSLSGTERLPAFRISARSSGCFIRISLKLIWKFIISTRVFIEKVMLVCWQWLRGQRFKRFISMVLSETFEISKFASFLDFYATGNYQNKFEAKKTFEGEKVTRFTLH